uniref:Uncharacterized protein n=1 Tax=Rhizoctonia cerealis phyllomonavirus TaxID=3068671 RepID=A0AA51BSD4_9MONO|nr:MAG: hypothetical protein [Rhizoctonia cerealis phyllomonavirus]
MPILRLNSSNSRNILLKRLAADAADSAEYDGHLKWIVFQFLSVAWGGELPPFVQITSEGFSPGTIHQEDDSGTRHPELVVFSALHRAALAVLGSALPPVDEHIQSQLQRVNEESMFGAVVMMSEVLTREWTPEWSEAIGSLFLRRGTLVGPFPTGVSPGVIADVVSAGVHQAGNENHIPIDLRRATQIGTMLNVTPRAEGSTVFPVDIDDYLE